MGVGAMKTQEPRAVFLDRDGVLNRAIVRDGRPYPPSSLEELEIFPEADKALARLRDLGFLLLVITNQPDVARGTQHRSTIERIHEALRAALPLNDFFVCYHDDSDGCECRKPGIGLLRQAADKYGIELGASFLIGDRWRDIDAGHNAGCTTVLIDYGYSERSPSQPPAVRVESLAGAVDWITRQSVSVRRQESEVFGRSQR